MLKKQKGLHEDKKIKFSKMFFNAWDWSVITKYDVFQLKSQTKNEIKLFLDEEKTKEIIKNRKRLEKTKLLVRRLITFTVNILFLFGGWILIIIININEEAIMDYFRNYRVLNKVA